jgi:VCBS repeat-containing protein
LSAPLAGLTVNPDGTFSFNPSDQAYDSLAAGATKVLVANYTVSDEQGGTATSTLTITVTGTNDAPVAVADINAGQKGAMISGSVATNDSDVDVGDTLNFTMISPAPAGFVLNSNGTYTLDASNPAYQYIREGEVQNVVIKYEVSDGAGGRATSTLTIAVTGRADAINIDIDVDNDQNLNTRRVFDAGAGAYNFSDSANISNTVLINNFSDDDYLTFEAIPYEAGTIKFSNVDFDGDGLANDLLVTINKGGVVSDIVLADAVDPSSLIVDRTTAEAAIGPGLVNFRFGTDATPASSPLPVGNTTLSLDVDNDNDLSTYRVFDASTDGFRFTDDDRVANTVLILNFGTDDRIVFRSGADVSFSSDDFDEDGLANDLIITTNVSGVESRIVIKDVVSHQAIIFNEATAEAALGHIDYFQWA